MPCMQPMPSASAALCGGDGVDVFKTFTLLDPFTPEAILGERCRRGLHRVLCEGGPRLFGDLVAADRVDELCLTVAPVLGAGDAGRIAVGQRRSALGALQLVGAVESVARTLVLRYA